VHGTRTRVILVITFRIGLEAADEESLTANLALQVMNSSKKNAGKIQKKVRKSMPS
jgi:hypothetical protein